MLKEQIFQIVDGANFKQGQTSEEATNTILNLFKAEYPIRYKEEADEVGDFIRRGWIPPEHFKETKVFEKAMAKLEKE